MNLEKLSSHFVYHCNNLCIILHHPSIRMPECRLIQALQLKHATPKCTMLKDRDFYGKSPNVPPNAPGVGEGLRGVLWILSAKSTRCTVNMVVEVARG